MLLCEEKKNPEPGLPPLSLAGVVRVHTIQNACLLRVSLASRGFLLPSVISECEAKMRVHRRRVVVVQLGFPSTPC